MLRTHPEIRRYGNDDVVCYDAQAFKLRKASYLNRVVPISLVPAATSNTLLIMGSKGTIPHGASGNKVCDYPLPLLLVLTGVASMAVIILGVTARYIVDLIFDNRYVSKSEKRLLQFLEILAFGLTGIQIVMLTTVTCVLIYVLNMAQSENPNSKENNYCERGLLGFSTVLMGVTWTFLMVAIGAYVYISMVANRRVAQAKLELQPFSV